MGVPQAGQGLHLPQEAELLGGLGHAHTLHGNLHSRGAVVCRAGRAQGGWRDGTRTHTLDGSPHSGGAVEHSSCTFTHADTLVPGHAPATHTMATCAARWRCGRQRHGKLAPRREAQRLRTIARLKPQHPGSILGARQHYGSLAASWELDSTTGAWQHLEGLDKSCVTSAQH